jgi:predicted  nucleic acid-binding Zn-ribbon protein
MKKLHRLILPGLLLLLATGSLNAADPSKNTELKLREALKSMALQLRDSESARATLQATETDSEQKIATLTTQLETLTKQSAADKEAGDKAVDDLKVQLAARDSQIEVAKRSIQSLETELKKVTDIARTKEAQRAKLDAEAIVLRRRVADQQVKNAAMYKIGTEILTRYEKFGLGEALTAREPFVGTTRVKLETLVQDYSDNLADQKIKP